MALVKVQFKFRQGVRRWVEDYYGRGFPDKPDTTNPLIEVLATKRAALLGKGVVFEKIVCSVPGQKNATDVRNVGEISQMQSQTTADSSIPDQETGLLITGQTTDGKHRRSYLLRGTNANYIPSRASLVPKVAITDAAAKAKIDEFIEVLKTEVLGKSFGVFGLNKAQDVETGVVTSVEKTENGARFKLETLNVNTFKPGQKVRLTGLKGKHLGGLKGPHVIQLKGPGKFLEITPGPCDECPPELLAPANIKAYPNKDVYRHTIVEYAGVGERQTGRGGRRKIRKKNACGC